MIDRQHLILRAIIQSFIQTGQPVGSKQLQESHNLDYSPATIRNEMMRLEQDGYIFSPHTSAGRIPTEEALREFAHDSAEHYQETMEEVQQEWDQALHEQAHARKLDFHAYDTVTAMTHLTPNVSFASVPSQERVFFLGMSNLIVQPEFAQNPELASGVFRILERNFDQALQELPLADQQPRIFIGEENMLAEVHSLALVVAKFSIGSKHGYVGVLGPMRMDYKRNLAVVQLAQQQLQRPPELGTGT